VTILPSLPPGRVRRSSNSQLRYFVIAVVVVAALVVGYLVFNRGGGSSPPPLSGSISLGVASSASAPPPPSMSATSLLAASVGAVRAEQWMSVSDDVSSTGTGVLVGRSVHAGVSIGNAALYLGKAGSEVADPAGASQQDGKSVEITSYLPRLLRVMGFSADRAAAAGRHYTRLAPSDPPYQAVALGLTIGSILGQLRVDLPLDVASTVLTQPLQASLPAYEITGSSGSGTAKLYVSPEAPYLPLRYEGVQQVAHEGTVTTTVLFTAWGQGQAIVGQVPQDSTPYAKIG
jgi:hypothetical protein